MVLKGRKSTITMADLSVRVKLISAFSWLIDQVQIPVNDFVKLWLPTGCPKNYKMLYYYDGDDR